MKDITEMLEDMHALVVMREHRSEMLSKFHQKYNTGNHREGRTYSDAELHQAIQELQKMIGRKHYLQYIGEPGGSDDKAKGNTGET